jgi:hypothetical protein
MLRLEHGRDLDTQATGEAAGLAPDELIPALHGCVLRASMVATSAQAQNGAIQGLPTSNAIVD